MGAATMRAVARSAFCVRTVPVLLFLGAVLAAPPAASQTPTPTPTPTVTPTPAPVTILPATTTLFGVVNGGQYDSSNIVVDPAGAVWTASGYPENVILRLSADRTTVKRWKMTTDATPGGLLREPDGTFWVTELGGFRIAKFDPINDTITEWPDAGRRPTAIADNPDGTLWLPETSGALTKFDPATGKFVYFRGPTVFSLTYPWVDPDGTLWSCDFLADSIVRFSPDGSHVTQWPFPFGGSSPAKIRRLSDGAFWITLFTSSQIARFDPDTAEFKVFDITLGAEPFDILEYRGRILYSDQFTGNIGFLDPSAATPSQTATLTPLDAATTSTRASSNPNVTALTTTEDPITGPSPNFTAGTSSLGVTEYPVGTGNLVWGIAVDERRGRIFFGTNANVGALEPPVGIPGDLYFPAAASVGVPGSDWKTQFIIWNRGTPLDATGMLQPLSLVERLLPDTWIAGFSPAATITLGPNTMQSQADPIGNEMAAPGSFGALKFSASGPLTDYLGFARIYRTRLEGGTWGYAQNGQTVDAALAPGDTGFFFAAPDPAVQRTNGGMLVVESSTGTISIVDPDGNTRLTYSYDWPQGYRIQSSSVFSAFGLDPIPSARISVSPATGRVLVFGVSNDNVTNDPTGLDFFGPKSPAPSQHLLGVARSGGPMGATSRTDLQLYNPNAADATVTLAFHTTLPDGSAAPTPGVPMTTVTVKAGKVLTLADVLSLFGVDRTAGTLDVLSPDQPVVAFARVRANAASGGTFGYGTPGRQDSQAIAAGFHGA
ncbi:MAG: hypothetical protein L3K06_04520, partial [Thermoplasmata archaeon]|nr:hypothetical protein [Thermoplasmata archaeon]